MATRKKAAGDESPDTIEPGTDQAEDITAGAIQQSDGENSPDSTLTVPTASDSLTGPGNPNSPSLPTPPTEPGTGGERNPAYLRALRAADPDKFNATCTRLRLYGDDIEKALRDPVAE